MAQVYYYKLHLCRSFRRNTVIIIVTCACTCSCISAMLHVGAGQPVGWCISDTKASEVIEAFLGAIQSRSPSTLVNAIMTDDGKCLISISGVLLYAHNPIL